MKKTIKKLLHILGIVMQDPVFECCKHCIYFDQKNFNGQLKNSCDLFLFKISKPLNTICGYYEPTQKFLDLKKENTKEVK